MGGTKDWSLQEYGGIPLRKAIAQGQTTWGEAADFTEEFFVAQSRAKLYHTDFKAGQVLWHPDSGMRVIDWGSYAVNPRSGAEGRIADVFQELTDHFRQEHRSLTAKMNHSRKQRMATAQKAAAKTLFSSPTNHTRGGS